MNGIERTLQLAQAEGVSRRLIVLTELDMFETCEKERLGGRVPKEVELVLAELPPELRARLAAARSAASAEVDPKKKK